MSAAIEVLPTLNGIPYFGPAKVVEADGPQGTVKITAKLMGAERVTTARLALPQATSLTAGDEVLIAGSHLKELFVIGVIPTPDAGESPRRILQAKSGAYTALSGSARAQEEKIQVYSKRNELLFEYDPIQELARVNVRKGHLELRTEDGDIRLSASQAVRLNGYAIDMNSNTLNANAGYAKFVFDRLETLAGTLVEQAKNVYRTVVQLTQLRTGRMRTLVDETYQFKANKAFMKSEDDFKIKGEKIHLG